MGVDPEDSLIYKLFCEWFEDWEPPDNDREWNKMLCPFHGERRPSSSISYDNDAFVCRSCDVTGDALTLIMREEDCGFQDAIARAESLLDRSYTKIQAKSAKKSGTRVFGEAKAPDPRKPRGTFTFPDWIR